MFGRFIEQSPVSWPIEINRQSPQSVGLEYWWPFIEPGEGRRIHEVVRGSHAAFDASMDDDSWVSTEYDMRAVAFDGTANDVATVPDEDGLSFAATGCALTFWFRATAWSSGKGLIGKWVTGNREWIIWCQSTNNVLEFARYTTLDYHPTTLAANAAFYDGTPTFVCARTLANGDIDVAAWKPSLGLLKSTPNTTGGWNTSGSEPLTFGSYGVGAGPGNELACEIWDARKYSRALSDDELLHMALSETRYELILRPTSAMAWAASSAAAPVGGRIMGGLAGLGGLAANGGLAGIGGGLAA